MKCKECEHFKILYPPLKSGGQLWDMGQAECRKHKLVVDFGYMAKLEKLECIEKDN